MSIIIIGGGMAGATLALAISSLTNGQLPVHLVEAVAPAAADHPGFDARAIALAQGTCEQLAAIGIWGALANCATPINTVYVSDCGHAGAVTLSASDYHIPALGHVVELHEIGLRLFKLLRQAPGVTLHCPDRVREVSRTQTQVSVELESGNTLTGSLLVAANGAQSPQAAACGIRWQRQAYHQTAIIANVVTQLPHGGRAWERFTEHGPLAMLPMSNNRCSLVWCHPLSDGEKVLAWDDAHFCDELQRAFGWRLGRILQAGKRAGYPLTLTRAVRTATHRLALVGNAAQTLHPIAGQGFNLGMRDVMSLAESVAQAWRDGADPGNWATLSAWQTRRAPDKAATIGVTDGLVQLFANRGWPLVIGRNAGLMAIDLIGPARDALAYRTLGWVAR